MAPFCPKCGWVMEIAIAEEYELYDQWHCHNCWTALPRWTERTLKYYGMDRPFEEMFTTPNFESTKRNSRRQAIRMRRHRGLGKAVRADIMMCVQVAREDFIKHQPDKVDKIRRLYIKSWRPSVA